MFVFAAVINKSVCLHKNAGICKISTWFETKVHCSSLCISVRTDTFNSFLILSNTGKDFSIPAPRLPLRLVLLALSNEVLYTKHLLIKLTEQAIKVKEEQALINLYLYLIKLKKN